MVVLGNQIIVQAKNIRVSFIVDDTSHPIIKIFFCKLKKIIKKKEDTSRCVNEIDHLGPGVYHSEDIAVNFGLDAYPIQ